MSPFVKMRFICKLCGGSTHAWVGADTHRVQKRAMVPWSWSYKWFQTEQCGCRPLWVLGAKSGSSVRAVHAPLQASAPGLALRPLFIPNQWIDDVPPPSCNRILFTHLSYLLVGMWDLITVSLLGINGLEWAFVFESLY